MEALMVNGIFKSVANAKGMQGVAAEQGFVASFGVDWENAARDMGVVFEKIPMQPQPDKDHNKPTVVDGVLVWEIG